VPRRHRDRRLGEAPASLPDGGIVMFNVSFAVVRMMPLVVATAAFVAHSASAQSPATARDRIPNLTGVWSLNNGLSDDAAKLMETQFGGDHGGSGAGHRPPGGAGGHGPGMHGGGGREMSPEQMRAMRARMMSALDAPARLTVTQADGSITITDSYGRSQRLATNNKKEQLPLDNRMVDVKTRWDDGRLVKETSLADGMKLTETYSTIAEPRQLHVMVKLEGSHLPRPIIFRRVYDAESVR
jgi:hypothetical protein